MKRLLLALFALSTVILQAQSLQILSADTLVMGNAFNSFDIEGHVSVKNTSSEKKQYLAKRIDTGYTSLTDSNAVCWGICFTPNVSVSPLTIEINPGETYNGFAGHVYPDQDGQAATGAITYVFYDAADTTDYVTFTMFFEVSQTFSVAERLSSQKLQVYPNPAQGLTEVNFQINDLKNHTFELYDLLGNQVYGRRLNTTQGNFNFDASRFSDGVYFYVLKRDGVVVESRKLIIR